MIMDRHVTYNVMNYIAFIIEIGIFMKENGYGYISNYNGSVNDYEDENGDDKEDDNDNIMLQFKYDKVKLFNIPCRYQ